MKEFVNIKFSHHDIIINSKSFLTKQVKKALDENKLDIDATISCPLILEEIDPGLVSRIPEAMRMLKKVKAR